jgi:acyl dehydratase
MTQTRIEPYIGQVLSPRQWTITTELVATYRGGLAVDQRPDVPQMLANAAEITLLFSQQRGHLWLRQEWEFHQPLALGATYTTEQRVTDIYPRRDRTILLTETILRDTGGEVVSIQRHHQSFLLDNPPSAGVVLRDPAAKEGAGRPALPVTQELAAIERTVTLEMCGEFFHGSKNYHSDKEQSQALGFQDVVVGGRMTMGYVGELLDATLGERWARTGRLLVKFTNVLWPSEAIHVTAGLGGPSPDDPSRDTVLARVEKADGTVVLVAEGSVERRT